MYYYEGTYVYTGCQITETHLLRRPVLEGRRLFAQQVGGRHLENVPPQTLPVPPKDICPCVRDAGCPPACSVHPCLPSLLCALALVRASARLGNAPSLNWTHVKCGPVSWSLCTRSRVLFLPLNLSLGRDPVTWYLRERARCHVAY